MQPVTFIFNPSVIRDSQQSVSSFLGVGLFKNQDSRHKLFVQKNRILILSVLESRKMGPLEI